MGRSREYTVGTTEEAISTIPVWQTSAPGSGGYREWRFWNWQYFDYIWHNSQWPHCSSTIQINHKLSWKKAHRWTCACTLTHAHARANTLTICRTCVANYQTCMFTSYENHIWCWLLVRNPDSNHNQRSINPEDTFELRFEPHICRFQRISSG